MQTNQTTRWIHLDHADDAEVVVTTEAGDVFTLPLQAAIQACGSAEKVNLFRKQFGSMLGMLSTWLDANSAAVQQAFVTFRDAGLLFLVVRNASRFDDAFEDSLTDLDLAVAQDENLGLIELSVLALPKSSQESVAAFLSPTFSLKHQHVD